MTVIISFSLGSVILVLLILAALHDAAARTIPNVIPAVMALLGVALQFREGTVVAGIVISLALLAMLFVLWLRGFIGGGDMKLIPAVALVLPPAGVPSFILFVSLAGGVLALLYLTLSLVVRRPRPGRRSGFFARLLKAEGWRIHRRGPLPYAVAIALGALPVVAQTFCG